MKVRFKPEYCADINNRLSYELESDEIEMWSKLNKDGSYTTSEYCYNLKLLGWIPTRKLEEADGTELPAIDVFIKLYNI